MYLCSSVGSSIVKHNHSELRPPNMELLHPLVHHCCWTGYENGSQSQFSKQIGNEIISIDTVCTSRRISQLLHRYVGQLCTVQRDQLCTVQRDQLCTVQRDQLCTVQRDQLCTVQRDQLCTVQRDQLCIGNGN